MILLLSPSSKVAIALLVRGVAAAVVVRYWRCFSLLLLVLVAQRALVASTDRESCGRRGICPLLLHLRQLLLCQMASCFLLLRFPFLPTRHLY